MKARAVVIPLLLLAAAGGAAWWFLRAPEVATSWRVATLAKGDVRAVVSSTGTLDAVTTVEVGTQVSGVVEALLADFNDPVTEGQVVARIDTSLLQADVESARASLAVRVAELTQAEQDLARMEGLRAREAATEQEVQAARTAKDVAAAQVRSGRVAVERAERNLGYATIRAPITGTVVERDVDVGQTVNAGMTAPRLFLIAGDLAHMQILAAVDEADIGRIADGQAVDFTVQAYPSDTFHGVVRQVRLQSTTTENVVTYTVVIDVANPDGRLLPGMTATVEFVVAEAHDVVCAPPAALRFRPEPEQIAGGGEGEGGPARGDGKAGEARPGGGSGRRRGGGGSAVLWVPVDDATVRAVRVERGLSDATCVAVSGEGVDEGLAVVTGVESAGGDDGGVKSPFAPQAQQRRPGGF